MDRPGDIRTQVGRCLFDIATNIEQQDTVGVANFTRFLVALSRPVLQKLPEHEQAIEAGLRLTRDEDGGFETQMEIVEHVLMALSEKNMYAYRDIEYEDAGELVGG